MPPLRRLPEGIERSSVEAGLSAAWYRGSPWLWLLRPLEGLFRSVAWLRRKFYQWGILASYRAPCPVVVVGNISVGGTGKTPVVIALVEALQARGIRPGVVSRGYGSRASLFPHLVTDQSSTDDCGDEPLAIFRRTDCPCVVDPSRPAAVRALLQQRQVDLIICDDGLQHYALQRNLEIAVMDAERGIGNGFCLPAGPLREPLSRLLEVDFVLRRGAVDDPQAISYRQDGLVNIRSGEQYPVLPAAIDRSVYAVAGIGQPQQFFRSLRAAGFDTHELAFADHHRYRAEDLAELTDRPIIMTEKDAVKCAHLVGDNAWYVKISAQLPQPLVPALLALLPE